MQLFISISSLHQKKNLEELGNDPRQPALVNPDSSFLIKENLRLKIQRVSGLFDGLTFNGMGIDHGWPDIAMPQQFLNRTNIVVCLQ